MNKRERMLEHLDLLIKELREAGKQEARDGASFAQRRLTGDTLLFLVRARDKLAEKKEE